MKKKVFLIPVIAIIVIANISLNFMKKDNIDNISLNHLFSFNSANAEHTSGYDCADPDSYYDKPGLFRCKGRVCEAPMCGKKYYSTFSTSKGTCSVFYE